VADTIAGIFAEQLADVLLPELLDDAGA